MKFAVVGATGNTGKPLVKQALDRGHHVKALVRNPKKLESLKHERLEVIETNIFDDKKVAEHLGDVDVILSTFGAHSLSRKISHYSSLTKTLVSAMKMSNVHRLILMHSWISEPESRKNTKSKLQKWFVVPLISPILDDMDRAEKFLKTDECQDIQWSIVLPPGLNNKPVTDLNFMVKEDVYFNNDVTSNFIARADVARFMVNEAEENKYERKVVCIATK